MQYDRRTADGLWRRRHEVDVNVWRTSAYLGICGLAFSCAQTTTARPHVAAHGDAVPPQDRAGELERLMLAATEYQTCKGQVGRLVGITSTDVSTIPPPDRTLVPVTGRLWLERCVARRESGGVHVALAGRGWTSVHTTRTADVGSEFAADGLTVFALLGEFSASFRVAGSSSTLSVWLPNPEVSALNFNLLRRPSIRPIDAVGQAGRVLTTIWGDYEQRIVTKITEEGTARARAALESGFTATIDLCTSQPDSVPGILSPGVRPRRPYADDGSRWLANERVQLDGDLVDFAGPYDGRGAPIRVETEVEAGSGIAVRVACVDQVRGYIDAWIRGQVSPDALRRDLALMPQPPRNTQDFDGRCPLVLVSAPLASNGATYRFRVSATRERPEPIVQCSGAP